MKTDQEINDIASYTARTNDLTNAERLAVAIALIDTLTFGPVVALPRTNAENITTDVKYGLAYLKRASHTIAHPSKLADAIPPLGV